MILAFSIMLLANPAWSLEPMDFQYFYDDLGQLTKTVDSQGVIIGYVYDEVGNLLQTKRSLAGELEIFAFNPQQGPEGISFTINGKGFSVISGENTVTINGMTATVVSATENTLEVTVPSDATSGPIEIIVGVNTAVSDNDFFVKKLPVLYSVDPALVATGTTISDFHVSGKYLSDASFSFFPEVSPPSITINSLNIAADGNSASLDISIFSDVSHTVFLISTNSEGNSGYTPSVNNSLEILAADGDADGDGISNGEELVLGSDPQNADSDNDSWPDGIELDFGGNLFDPAIGPKLYTAAQPPHIITVRPGIGDTGSLPLNTITASPPIISVVRPGTDDTESLPLNTIVANPPVKLDYSE